MKYVPDIVLLIGLIFIGCGLGFYSIPLALVSLGSLLVLISLHVSKNTVIKDAS